MLWVTTRTSIKIEVKNSLHVIGHTHTSALCLSPNRHSGGVCGPSCGASQSVHCTAFFTPLKCAPAVQIISLSQSYNTPTGMSGPFIYPMKKSWHLRKPESGFSLPCSVMSSCQGGRGGEICENAAHPTFYPLDDANMENTCKKWSATSYCYVMLLQGNKSFSKKHCLFLLMRGCGLKTIYDDLMRK